MFSQKWNLLYFQLIFYRFWKKHFGDFIIMNKKLVASILKVEIKVRKPQQILIHMFWYLSDFYGTDCVLYFKASIITSYLWCYLVDLVLKEKSIHLHFHLKRGIHQICNDIFVDTVNYYVWASNIDYFLVNIIRKLVFCVRKTLVFLYRTIIYRNSLKSNVKIVTVVFYWLKYDLRGFKFKAPIHKKWIEKLFNYHLKLIF